MSKFRMSGRQSRRDSAWALGRPEVWRKMEAEGLAVFPDLRSLRSMDWGASDEQLNERVSKLFVRWC